MSKTALLVVDVQKAYHEFPILKPYVDLSLFAIHPALNLFRSTHNPVFFVHHTDKDFTPEGSPGFELSDALDRKEKEHKIVKRFPNSFHRTDLAEKLKEEGVNFVVICGLAASKCVMATLQGALESGFKAAILQHGVADIKESLIQVPYDVCPIISFEVLQHFL